MNNICQCEEISEERKATAPYNFVPLPEEYFSWEDINGSDVIKPWENNDKYCKDTYTGYITFSVELKTPIYIRGQKKKKQNGLWEDCESNEIAEPYSDFEGKPCIPGSSFRGMIRNIVEILSFSKISPVSQQKLFYRNFTSGNVSAIYRRKFPYTAFKKKKDKKDKTRDYQYKDNDDEIRAGYFHRNDDGNGGYIQTCQCKKCSSDFSEMDFEVVTIGKDDLIKSYAFETESHAKDYGSSRLDVGKDIIELFESDDQITDYQKTKFPKGEEGRYKDGALKEGEPVFYIEDEKGEVGFLGRAKYFRIPFDFCATDLIGTTDSSYLSFSDGLFGKIDGDNNNIKGRIVFSDLRGNVTEMSQEAITPKILASPKHKCYQLYLVQDSDDKDKLISYFNDEEKSRLIRGHKFYWHRWNNNNLSSNETTINELVKMNQNNNFNNQNELNSNFNKNMITSIKLVLRGNLKGRIRFNNLTKFELGALLTSLELPDYCCHKIGMGKPLGLGSIRVFNIELNLLNKGDRYKNWLNKGFSKVSDKDVYKKTFKNKIVELANRNQERFIESDNDDDFNNIYRINALFNMLNWKNRPNKNDTEYMPADTKWCRKYSKQNILPTPFNVINKHRPQFKKKIELDKKNIPIEIVESDKTVEQKDLKSEIKYWLSLSKEEKIEKGLTLKCQKGKTVNGIIVNLDNKWKAFFKDDIRILGDIEVKSIPENITDNEDGKDAEFLVKDANKRELPVRFLRWKGNK